MTKKNPLDLISIASLMLCDMPKEKKLLILESMAQQVGKKYIISLLEEFSEILNGVEDKNDNTKKN